MSGECPVAPFELAVLLVSRNVVAVGEEELSVFGCGGSFRRFPEPGRAFGTVAVFALTETFVVVVMVVPVVVVAVLLLVLPPPPSPPPLAAFARSLLRSTALCFGPPYTECLDLQEGIRLAL